MVRVRKLETIRSLNKYDFVDLGAGDGGSLVNCEKIIGGEGLGVEMSLNKVEKATRLNRNVVHGNALDIHKLPGKADFVTCDNFLEHLPTFTDVNEMLKQATLIARDYIYIRHPSFEDISYLEVHGLKTYWSDWRGHTSMLKVSDITGMLRSHGVQAIKVSPVSLIANSDDSRVLPLDAPVDQHNYDIDKHGPKPSPAIEFDKEVFYAFDIVGLMPGTKKELPTLEYKDRLGSDRRPSFISNEDIIKSMRQIDKLNHDIFMLKNRKSLRAASFIGNKIKGVKKNIFKN